MEFNKLYINDKGIGKTIIKLNGQDVTNGITDYSLDRSVENDGYITLKLTMIVIPEYINIESNKKNSKSSNIKA